MVVTGIIGAGLGAAYGAYKSYQETGSVDWKEVGKDALIGGAIGLGAGMGASYLATGSATASVSAVTGIGSSSVAAGLSATKITKTLVDNRLQHATEHLRSSGILPNWCKNTEALAKSFFTNILSNPDKTFEYALRGGELCDGFLKNVNGQKIIVLIYKTGEFAGEIATSFVANQNQIEKLGL